jgi:hypothetical protein
LKLIGRVSTRSAARRPHRLLALVAASILLIMAACSSDDSVVPKVSDSAASDSAAAASPDANANYVLFNQNWLEGLSTQGLDVDDADSLFTAVFAGLPDEVTVFPSENYYYFILTVDGKQIWGNIRLPAGRRENGVLSFGYYEFIEFPTAAVQGISGSKFFTDADGVIVAEVDRFTWTVRFRGRTVTFHLHELDQSPSANIPLGENELFIQRTFDESGYQFYLVFNEVENYFVWVLNEEETVPEVFDPGADNLLFGRRSGFAFWVDSANGDRKVLAGVRRLNLQRNDYYDGPFDQLADNYADETHISDYMKLAFPSLEGRIDKFGYYTDQERPLRVAISSYFIYSAQSEMVTFVEQLKVQDDPLQYISSGGRTE